MGHKTLHESAAEILAASVANAGKEPIPMAAMMNPSADLGGELPTGEVSPIGMTSAQQVDAAAKPGRPGAPAEEMKALPAEGEEEVEAEEEKEEDSEKLMESLIAEHGPELVLENLITEYGDAQVFGAIMEEYIQEFGEETVYEKFSETLVEQYGEEAVSKFVVESIVADFHEQEYSDEEFQSLSESSEAFITEMQTLSEEEFDDYIANLTEEELVSAIQLSSLNEEYLVEFLKKIRKALKKGVKKVGKFVGKVVSNPLFSTVASFALPGVGSLAAGLGSKLASTALGKAVGAVGSKIAGSALGKGVAALGKTAIGGALKSAAGSAIKSGIGSKLSGGSFSQGAKAGALGSVAGSIGGALGSAVKNVTGSNVAGDLASNIASTKIQGGSARDAVVGTLAGAAGDRISQATGSNVAGDAASARLAAAGARKPRAAETEPAEEPTETAAAEPDQEERVAAAPQPRKQIKPARAAAEDDDADYADTWRIRRGSRMVAEEADEILEELSSLNEEELSQFIDQLSDEDAELIADVLEENAIIRAGAAAAGGAARGARAVTLTAAEKASAIPGKLAGQGLKGALKTGARIAGKVALPLTVAMGGYDAYKGYTADPNATTAQKLKNAGSSALSGLTLGLAGQDAEAIAAGAKPAAASAAPKTTQPKSGRNTRGAQARIDADKARDAKTAEFERRMQAERERIDKEGLKAGDGTQIIPPKASKPSTAGMSDEQKYGKTGAEIIRLGGMDAYKNRPKDKEGNLKYLEQLRKGQAGAGAGAAAATAAPATTAAPTTPAAATVAPAQTAPAASQRDSNWDYLDTWEGDPISRANGGRGGSMADDEVDNRKPEKTYGDQAIDQLKRTGRSALRTAIGGAILGQDPWKAAQAGATGQVVGDVWKAFSKGWSNQQKKQQGMNESIEESHMNGEETTMETTELTEEQIREERMLAIKEAVKQFKGNMREDVDALFNGESLSEEFRAKATLIFESAVTARVESILEEVMEQNDQVLSEAYDEIRDNLTEQVDEYLNYVVEQWMEENQVAIETGLRAELAEDFISGLRSLFQEHYIEIPEDKVDVAETLATELEQAAEYVEGVHEYVAEQEEAIAALQEQLNAVKKEKTIDNFCEGLTAVQAAKMKALAEGVEFTTEGDFEEKLAVLRENYFPTKVQVKSEVKELQQVALNEEPEVAQTNNIMNRYVQAIAKTAPKA